MKPALTPEQWAAVGGPNDFFYHDEGIGIPRAAGSLVSEHGAAALCLHGQPFGFTWEDVDRLMQLAGHWEGDGNVVKQETWVTPLAQRIAALLPPRGQDE